MFGPSQCSVRRLLGVVLPLVAVAVLGACAATPAYEGLPPDRIYTLAQREFEEEDWQDAIDALDRLLSTAPSFEHTADARMLLAESYFNNGQYILAQQQFQIFLERHGNHPRTPEAALGICRGAAALSPIIERDQTPTRRAELICANVARDWADINDGVAQRAEELHRQMRRKLARSQYESAMFYYDRDYDDSSIIYLELVVERYPDTEFAPRAMARIIEVYSDLGYRTDLAEWRQRLLDEYPDSPEARALVGAVGPE